MSRRFDMRRLLLVGVVLLAAITVACNKAGRTAQQVRSDAVSVSDLEQVDVSGSVESSEAPIDFVQSLDPVSISGTNLADSPTYKISVFYFDSRGQKFLVHEGASTGNSFTFKSRIPKRYVSIEAIRLSDGAKFAAILPPPFGSKIAKVKLDRTTTIANKILDIIGSKAVDGHTASQSALVSGSVSVADVLMTAQSVRRTIDEQKTRNNNQSIDLTVIAINLVVKSNERLVALKAEGQSTAIIAVKLSEKAYEIIFSDAAESYSPGLLAYRVNHDLGLSTMAKMEVAYEVLKVTDSMGMKQANEAFRIEASAYRTVATLPEAKLSESQINESFKSRFTVCLTTPDQCAVASYTPPSPPVPSGLNTNGSTFYVECSQDGQTGCIATEGFKAADMRSVLQTNIKSGVTIAGVQGGLATPDSWDLRAGVSINGVSGRLKVNCRNRVNPGVFNYDGSISLIGQQQRTANSSSYDIWDTIDDLNGLPPNLVIGWSGDTDCSGVNSANTPEGIWRDVTTTDGATASSCDATPANCAVEDKITGLWWSSLQLSPQPLQSWDSAWIRCVSLNNANYNGKSSGWRLPTQKELMQAYTHGFSDAAVKIYPAMASQLNSTRFWSGSSNGGEATAAWDVDLTNGSTGATYKNELHHVICVR